VVRDIINDQDGGDGDFSVTSPPGVFSAEQGTCVRLKIAGRVTAQHRSKE
jgi:hypothetical protein